MCSSRITRGHVPRLRTFSRRAFNVEAILCLPQSGGEQSRIWLLVNEDERLEQMIRQMRKLQDVHDVRLKPDAEATFASLGQVMCE